DASTRRHWLVERTLAGVSPAAFGDSPGDLVAVEDWAVVGSDVACSQIKQPGYRIRWKPVLATHLQSGSWAFFCLLRHGPADLREILLNGLTVLFRRSLVAALFQIVSQVRNEFVPIGKLRALGNFFRSLWRGFFQRPRYGPLIGLLQLFLRPFVLLL